MWLFCCQSFDLLTFFLFFFFFSSIDTGLENAFDVHCPFEASVEIDVMEGVVGAQTINASLNELECTLHLVNTNVGNVSVPQIQGLISLAIDLVKPIINKKLSNLTIPIPSLGSVNLTNSEIKFIVDGQYFLVATDVKLANGTKLEEQEKIGAAVTALQEKATMTKLASFVYDFFGIFPMVGLYLN